MRIVQARAFMAGSCLAATACMDGMGPGPETDSNPRPESFAVARLLSAAFTIP